MKDKVYLNNRFIILCCTLLILVSCFLRFPNSHQNFENSDATYHVLLTMKAYDSTHASVHHFLPIVSLGNDEDKNIPCGATVSDRFGNYYYTSFSPAGFVAPYIFVKIFNLSINEISLYLFNSILYILCFIMTTILFVKLFNDRLSVQFIVLLVTAIYLFQPEILHSQGIVYWHQSLFQLLFLIQLNLFVRLKSKIQWVFFFITKFNTSLC